MAIEITDRYKLIFEEHHYASDFRAKIIQGWCLFYAAFAAGLGWTQANANAKPVSWILSAFAFVLTFSNAGKFRSVPKISSSTRTPYCRGTRMACGLLHSTVSAPS